MKWRKAEKVAYFITALMIALMLAIAVVPKETVYAPYRDAFVVKIGPVFDTVTFNDHVFLTKHNNKRRRLSIIRCRRVFKVGLFSKKEINPECGV